MIPDGRIQIWLSYDPFSLNILIIKYNNMSLNIKTTALMLLLAYQAIAQHTIANENQHTEVMQVAREFLADRGSLSRFYEISYSPERRERFRTFYNR
jgi:hypothetical protein